MRKNQVVFGIYPNRESMEEGIAELRAAGFRNTDTSVFFAGNVGTKELAHEKSTKLPEGFTFGACAGAVIAGVLGWLAAVGLWAIPEFESFFAAGPIMTALAGIGAGGIVGGAIGALAGLALPEYEAKRYKGRLRNGGILASVHCDDSQWVKKAKEVLLQTGAEDIATTSEREADFAISDKPMPRRTKHVEATKIAVRAEKSTESEKVGESHTPEKGVPASLRIS